MWTRDHTVLPAAPQCPTRLYRSRMSFSVTTLCLVLISRSAEGRRLSWPGWLSEILRWFAYGRWSPIPLLTWSDRVTLLICPTPLTPCHTSTRLLHLSFGKDCNNPTICTYLTLPQVPTESHGAHLCLHVAYSLQSHMAKCRQIPDSWQWNTWCLPSIPSRLVLAIFTDAPYCDVICLWAWQR